MTATPKVVIVILNWNNAPDTIACLQSVSDLQYPNAHVLVVDNGSEDDSVAKIRQSCPGIDLLELGSNLGYAEGNNAGIRRALDLGADYVFILNNDTLVAPTLLAELVQFAESRPAIGMVGPTVFCTDPEDTLFALGSFVQWKVGDLWHRGMFEPVQAYSDRVNPEPVDFIVGCGVLVHKKLIEAAGVFDPSYYLNYEDVEWGIRARRYNFEVWVAPQAVMWHKVSATLGLASPANTYYMTRNALLFFWRNAPGLLRWLSVSNILFRTIRTILAWSIKPQYQTPVYHRKRAANLYALRDFYLGRYGKMGSDVARVCYGG